MGAEVTVLPVDGRSLVDPDDVRRALRPNTKLISIMMANNETGVLQPVEEIAKIAAEAGVCFHTDAVQAAGKVAIDVARIGCNALSISGHKIHAPQGVGALYREEGNSAAADALRRQARTFAASWHGKRPRNCWPGQGRRVGEERLLTAATTRRWRPCATACSREFLRRSTRRA